MSKFSLMFSGQGAQYVGMGKELYDNFPVFRDTFDECADFFSLDLAAFAFDSDERTLSQTKISQPVIFSVSMATLAIFREIVSKNPAAICGHSLGEYAALTAAEVMPLRNACSIVAERAKVMQDAADSGEKGAMAAIIGSNAETIREICAKIDGYVIPVNFNSPTQTVIAGEIEALESASKLLEESGAKVVRLAVSSAFHSRFMSSAADNLANFINSNGFEFKQSAVDFYSNVTGCRMSDFSGMPDYFAVHLVSPVRFADQIQNMISDGIDTFIEIGPNKILTGLVKKIDRSVTAQNSDSVKAVDKIKSLLS